ncbi:dihydroorotase [Tenacibaculum todarodis]|uniref:Dihydroorotase n=1 Tax=Tenacibaculum todarodis TaxID=1850252 RepID=A0A1L3JIB7_9FLAO|nr:dihydroorotase [Tenacibaculum todarodis]APG64875.1 dihydroorotase [Tenacibaculum todarodis]
MKNNILSTVLAFFITLFMFSQSSESDFNSGDIFIIGSVKFNNYKHINFPKDNFIIKKGGLANYKNIKGEKVIITSIKQDNKGKRVAIIKLVNSRKFFNSHRYITVDIEEAIENRELLPFDN